ncbi:hypothetical protein C8T65DRAFT_29127 [Cerioporus squamosus]|nr:hypothetical protein C8T65DRAFT_29127 [Cerioporus squamosus]
MRTKQGVPPTRQQIRASAHRYPLCGLSSIIPQSLVAPDPRRRLAVHIQFDVTASEALERQRFLVADSDKMATPAEWAAQAETNIQQVVRVVTYALEDLASLGDEWFVHDEAVLEHRIKRGSEEFLFTKIHFSNRVPPYIGFQLSIPQRVAQDITMTPFNLWVCDPDPNTARNRRATIGALERLRDTRNLQAVQVSAADNKYA